MIEYPPEGHPGHCSLCLKRRWWLLWLLANEMEGAHG